MNADARHGAFQNVINISQGEHAVSSAENDLISTVLGSCVATCLWDEQAAIGGMNHILLPQDLSTTSISQMHGVNAMEVLINAMIKSGAVKSRIRAKLFGGARMVAGLSNIGERNAVFAQEFLRGEGILCEAKNLGGTMARRIQFWPSSGRVLQKIVGTSPVEQVVVAAPANDVELF
ncbi:MULTISPECIES: chemotaxis protein CheD [Falsihalocynthiibacter]|uniref:chemotaxis protein CheD n=1 Tax=Falsihalocynthiibacter TaxID=2854182 RepID=UPI003002370A